MHRQMSLLRDLQAMDSYIDRLRQELSQLDSGERIRAKLEKTRQRMEDIKERYNQSYAIAAEQERRLQEFDERIRRAEAELYSGRITNPRELQLLQHEIEQAKQTREELDVQMLRMWETLETLKQDIDASERDLQQLERLYEAHVEDYRQRKAALESEIAFNERERENSPSKLTPRCGNATKRCASDWAGLPSPSWSKRHAPCATPS
jgi:predicted  nucleic acid-binding Zn-ribbon protein